MPDYSEPTSDSPPDTDRESIRIQTTAVRAGDVDALARFYEAWFDFVLIEARQFTRRDESFGLDVVQEVMLRVIKSLKPMEDLASLRGWLRVVTHSCATDLIRRETRERRRGGIFQLLREGINLRQRKERKVQVDNLSWLDDALIHLDAPAVQLLTMRYRFGWTLSTIGTQLGVPPGSVHRRLNKITNELRTRAEEQNHV